MFRVFLGPQAAVQRATPHQKQRRAGVRGASSLVLAPDSSEYTNLASLQGTVSADVCCVELICNADTVKLA